MKKTGRFWIWVVVGFITANLAGCVVYQRPSPPPHRVEIVPVRPGVAYVWIPGRWEWRHHPRTWFWTPGHWQARR